MTTDITVLARDIVDSVATTIPFLKETGERVIAAEAINGNAERASIASDNGNIILNIIFQADGVKVTVSV